MKMKKNVKPRRVTSFRLGRERGHGREEEDELRREEFVEAVLGEGR